MRRMIIAVLVVMVSGVAAWSGEGEKVTLASLQPVVVKTVPQAGETDVDPSITEIQVTFSKKMMDKTWSWAGVDESWSPGKPHYLADGKTCVLPVKLKPGKTYVFWANSPSFQNFKDSQGQSSLPYLVGFQTAKK